MKIICKFINIYCNLYKFRIGILFLIDYVNCMQPPKIRMIADVARLTFSNNLKIKIGFGSNLLWELPNINFYNLKYETVGFSNNLKLYMRSTQLYHGNYLQLFPRLNIWNDSSRPDNKNPAKCLPKDYHKKKNYNQYTQLKN